MIFFINKICCLFCLVALLVCGCVTKLPLGNEPPTLTKAQQKLEASNHQCATIHSYSSKERLKFYPFNKAVAIKIVSYKQVGDTGQIDKPVFYSLPSIRIISDYDKLIDNIELGNDAIDSLTNIIFKIGYKGKILKIQEFSCYTPRNAILFIGQDGLPFESIDICFGCLNFKSTNDEVNLGDECEVKFELIKNFFRVNGVRYGLD